MNILARLTQQAKDAARAFGQSVSGRVDRLRSGVASIRARWEARGNLNETPQTPVPIFPEAPISEQAEGRLFIETDDMRGPFLDIDQAESYAGEIPFPTEIVLREHDSADYYSTTETDAWEDDDDYIFLYYVVINYSEDIEESVTE